MVFNFARTIRWRSRANSNRIDPSTLVLAPWKSVNFLLGRHIVVDILLPPLNPRATSNWDDPRIGGNRLLHLRRLGRTNLEKRQTEIIHLEMIL